MGREQLGDRTEAPLHERRRAHDRFRFRDLAVAHAAGLGRDLPQDVDDAADPVAFVRKRLEKACLVTLPARRDSKREVREHQGREAVGIERAKRHATVQPDAAQCARDQPFRATLADVVETDVELIEASLVAATKRLRVAAGDVVRFEHERTLPRRAQIRRAGEPAEARADHDRLPRPRPLARPFC